MRLTVAALVWIAARAGVANAAPPAGAAPAAELAPSRGLVVVLRPGEVDELTRTGLARVTGELTAARFQVRFVTLDPAVDPTLQVESVSPESFPVAAFAIAHVADARGDTVVIWVCDRLGGRTTIQRMAMRGGDVSQEAEVLALEAIELIRVSIAGLWPSPRASEPEADTSATVLPLNHIERRWRSLGFGISVLRDNGITTPLWTGSATGTLEWRHGLLLRAELDGLGSSAILTNDDSTATVHREIAMLGLGWISATGERVRVAFIGSAGAEHVGAAGAAPDPARAHSASAWSALGSVGAAVFVPLGSRISLVAETKVVVSWSRLVLRLADAETEPLNRPGFVGRVGIEAHF